MARYALINSKTKEQIPSRYMLFTQKKLALSVAKQVSEEEGVNVEVYIVEQRHRMRYDLLQIIKPKGGQQ